jgi:serine/threonine-protein kinase
VFSVLTLGNIYGIITGNPGSSVSFLLPAALMPIFPLVGFHVNQARKQFRAGYTLRDLRSALDVAQKEQDETEALTQEKEQSAALRALQIATIGAAGWLAATMGLLMANVIHENRTPIVWIFAPAFTTLILGAVSNAFDLQFIPRKIKRWWQTGIRDRLWKSSIGEWIARQLGAPQESRAVGGGVFRPTEAVLGVAASELFAALPETYRVELFELPEIVTALEARAAEARAEIDVVAALAHPGSDAAAAVLDTRRKAASASLAASVGALERIRLDLLKLHSGASDLKPLTTLIEEAQLISEDVRRLAEAEQEVEDAIERRYS